MDHSCGAIVRETIEHCRALMQLAERGMAHCTQDGCMVLFGMMLDSAYRLKASAEAHRIEWHGEEPVLEGTGPWSGE